MRKKIKTYGHMLFLKNKIRPQLLYFIANIQNSVLLLHSVTKYEETNMHMH